MGSTYKIGDRIRIKRDVRPYGGRLGKVVEIDEQGLWIWLDLMSSASTPHLKFYRANEVDLAELARVRA